MPQVDVLERILRRNDWRRAAEFIGWEEAPKVNVAAYAGWHGDGVADDTGAWVLAMAAAGPGSIVEAPPGITSMVQAQKIKIPNGVMLDGSNGLTLKYNGIGGGTNLPILGFASTAPVNILVKGLTIDIAGASTHLVWGTTSLSGAQATPGIIFDSCVFMSSVAGTLTATSQTYLTIPAANSQVRFCLFTGLAQTKLLFGQFDCGVLFNRFTNKISTPFTFSMREISGQNTSVIGNLFDGIGGVGLVLAQGANIVFNSIIGLTGTGTLPAFSNGIMFQSAAYANVTNNIVQGSTTLSTQSKIFNTLGTSGNLQNNIVFSCTFTSTIMTVFFLNQSDHYGCSGNICFGNAMSVSTNQLIGIGILNTGFTTSPIIGCILSMAVVSGGTNVGILTEATGGLGAAQVNISGNIILGFNTGVALNSDSVTSGIGNVTVSHNCFGSLSASTGITGSWLVVNMGASSILNALTVTGNTIYFGNTDAVYGAVIQFTHDWIFSNNTYSGTGGAASLGCLQVANCGGIGNVNDNVFNTAASAPATAVSIDATSPVLVSNNSGAGTITSISGVGANIQKANNFFWNGAAWAAA